MAFTTKEFPNKTFEGIKEYEVYLELRKKIAERLKIGQRTEIKTRAVKITNVIRRQELLQQILLWILKSQRT